MTDSQANKAPLWKRALPSVIAIAIIVYVFGWVLPQAIDYEAVFRKIGEVSFVQWILLVVIAAIRLVPEAWVYVAAQPGLKFGQGMSIFLVSNAMAMVPPGGLDLISRFQMSRGWGFTPAESTSATIGSFLFSTIGKLAMPIIAVAFFAAARIRDEELDALAWIALIVILGGGVLVFALLRDPRVADWLGRVIGSFVRWVAGLFRREVKTDFGALVHEFRAQNSELLRTRWHVGSLAGLVAQLASYAVLFAAIRFVGVGPDELSWVLIFAAFSAAAALTAIPFLNIPGIAEAIYIGALNAASSGDIADELAAAVFIFRILTWLAPVPVGALAYSRWKKQSGSALTESDLLESPETS